MQKQPLVSFIIPAFNVDADMLRECLESIMALSLSREEREIILIDDGSDVPAICSLTDVADEIVYLRQPNKGLSEARNIGIKLATGRFVQFVDADDHLIWAPYEHCLDIARYHNPDLVLFESTSKEEKQPKTPFAYDGPKTGSSYMRQNNMRAAAWGYLFERQILGRLRFTPGLYHEDEEFTPQLMLRSERLYTTDAKAYYYRMRSGSIVNNDTPEHTRHLLADTERILEHLQSLVVPEHDRPALNRRIAQLTMDYLYNVIRRTRDRKTLEETMERLTQKGLYPLPDRNYTKKYVYFRKMMSHSVTRRLLFLLIIKR